MVVRIVGVEGVSVLVPFREIACAELDQLPGAALVIVGRYVSVPDSPENGAADVTLRPLVIGDGIGG
jgi:hypothetical protein